MIYAFALQLRAVSTFFPNSEIRPIARAGELRNAEMGTFVYCTPHGYAVPRPLMDVLQERGFVIIHVNEQHARDYHTRKK